MIANYTQRVLNMKQNSKDLNKNVWFSVIYVFLPPSKQGFFFPWGKQKHLRILYIFFFFFLVTRVHILLIIFLKQLYYGAKLHVVFACYATKNVPWKSRYKLWDFTFYTRCIMPVHLSRTRLFSLGHTCPLF